MTSVPPVGAYGRLRETIWIAGVGLITPNVIGKVIPSTITGKDEVMIEWPLLGAFTTIQFIHKLAAGYGVDAPLAHV